MEAIRVDVITLQAVQNYGSVLQALATQKILEKHGCEVTIINYIREDIKPRNTIKDRSGGNPIKEIILLPTAYRWRKVFTKFINKHLNLSEKLYTSEEDFKQYPLTADAYCTGSDQVWNSKWNKGVLPCLYLSFVPESCYKFSFAASFGKNRLSDDEVLATKKYMQQYNRVSVRENSAKKILEEQYGIQGTVCILDPTVCVSGNFWRKYATPRKIMEDYILIYNLNRSREFDQYAVELSKRTGLKLVRLCNRYDQFYRPGKSILVPEVFDFISLIDNAKYVLTDSFHATAFSMNMNTEPICVYPKEFGGRIENFLTLVNSLHRHIADYNDFDVVNRPVDFVKVNSILENERQRASDFIDKVIEDIRKIKNEREKNSL